MKRNHFIFGGALLALLLSGWLLTTDSVWVWPVRNTLQYHLLAWFNGPPTPPNPESTGALAGKITNLEHQPIDGARVLVAHRDGTTFSTRTGLDGQYRLEGLPPGAVRPVAGAPGHRSMQAGNWGGFTIRPGGTTLADIKLSPLQPPNVAPGTDLQLSAPETVNCSVPFDSTGVRRVVNFNSGGQPNQPIFYYTPESATESDSLPLLLAIYPGPADSWECASIPLAQAGYAVLSAGPAYTFDLESDLDELERLLNFARAGRFPGTNGQRVGLLGGSYSTVHVQRMLQRNPKNANAALLLGPPTDLFDMRRRLENGSYIPPFGLDKALVALGLPDEVPLRYWDYSGAYHARPDFPPQLILHSRHDEVVPYQQSQLLADNLDQVGAPYELHFFDGASHYLMAEGGGAQQVYDIALEFLARQLKTEGSASGG